MTQTARVLDILRRVGEEGLTPDQARAEVGTARLAARISDAKELLRPDEEIVALRFRTPRGAVVARYVLRHRTSREAVPMSLWPEPRP